MMRALCIISLFFVAFLLLAPFVSLAVPQLTSVHGKLSDVSGNPITGNFDFIFKIYSVESGGTPLWTEYWNSTNEQVTLGSGGYFSVLLGSHTAINLPFDQQYWLSIQVANDLLSPRFKMGSTPYTYRANITENLAAGTKAAGTLNMNNFDITSAGAIYGATLYEGGTALSSKYTLQTRTLTAGSGLTGGGTLAADRTFSLNYGTDLLGWGNLTSYPAGCGAGQAVQAVGDTLTCADLNSTSGNVSGTGTSGYVSRFTGAGTIGNSIIYDSGTNVGIGTTPGSYKLHVKDTLAQMELESSTGTNRVNYRLLNTGGDVLFGIESSAGGQISLGSSPYAAVISHAGNYPMQFGTNNNIRLTLDSAGNIGIATTNPQNKLNVIGDINATTGIYGATLYEGGTSLSSKYALQATQVSAGSGLTGGGDLSATRTLSLNSSYLDGSYYDSRFVNDGESAGGDLTGTYPNPTIAANAVALGTDTAGEYVYNLTQGTGISISGGTGEGSTPTINIDTTVVPRKNQQETISEDWTFQKNIFVGGNITYVNSETLNVNGSIVPPLDNWFNVGAPANRWAKIYGVNIYQSGNLVLDNSTSFSGDVSGAFNNLQIGAGVVGSTEIASGAVTNIKIAANSVNKTQISGVLDSTVVGSLDAANITTGTIASGRISGVYSGITGLGTQSQNLDLGGYNITNYTYIVANDSAKLNGQSASYYLDTSSLAQTKSGSLTVTGAWLNASNLNVSSNAYFGGNVGIGTISPSAKLEVNGGVRMNTTETKPACGATQRGTLWFEQSAGGTDDYMYACMRNTTGNFNWILVARGG